MKCINECLRFINRKCYNKYLACITLACLCVFLFSCKDKASKTSSLSPTGGSVGEILVVMEKNKWESPVGDSIRTWFKQPQYGLPQAEPLFDVINLPQNHFKGGVLSHRNTIVVKFSDTITRPVVTFKENKWARSQQYFQIDVPNDSVFMEVFNLYKQDITKRLLDAERNRLVKSYKAKPEQKIFNHLKHKYKIELSIPGTGYNINKESDGFFWISLETKVDSRGIVFFEKPYTDTRQFELNSIVQDVKEVLKENIPGPRITSYMSLDTITPMSYEQFQYQEKHYAVQIRGLWDVVNDFMAGPFVLNVVLDQQNNRVLYTMGYVYAPDDKKRAMTRQVEGILFTLDF